MNYIYDILANFNEHYYDFYDWNELDNLIHIKKLPLIKCNSNFLYNIKYNDIIVEKKLVDKIYKKADFFSNKTNKVNYVCAITDGRTSLIAKFNHDGSVIERSSLLIDEENEIIDIAEEMNTCEYNYVVKQNKKIENFKTRKEIEISKYILTKLENIEDDKLRYLYFDCFDKEEIDTKIILNRIIYEIKNNFNNIYTKIYDFLKMTS